MLLRPPTSSSPYLSYFSPPLSHMAPPLLLSLSGSYLIFSSPPFSVLTPSYFFFSLASSSIPFLSTSLTLSPIHPLHLLLALALALLFLSLTPPLSQSHMCLTLAYFLFPLSIISKHLIISCFSPPLHLLPLFALSASLSCSPLLRSLLGNTSFKKNVFFRALPE